MPMTPLAGLVKQRGVCASILVVSRLQTSLRGVRPRGFSRFPCGEGFGVSLAGVVECIRDRATGPDGLAGWLLADSRLVGATNSIQQARPRWLGPIFHWQTPALLVQPTGSNRHGQGGWALFSKAWPWHRATARGSLKLLEHYVAGTMGSWVTDISNDPGVTKGWEPRRGCWWGAELLLLVLGVSFRHFRSL